jgi:phosphoglycerate kinase
MLLENLRFHPGEEQNDDEFAKELASLADVYINDAFAVAHRAHASVVAITKFAPISGAGFLMKNELNYFYRAMEDPARPFVAIIGGAKVSSKIPAIENLMDRVDKLIIGGAMANTFLKVIYPDVGTQSLVEEDLVEKARSIMRKARDRGVKFYLPVDCVVANKFDPKAETKIATVQEVPEDWMIVDIGPATSSLFAEALQDAKTIIWNGPMGAFEVDAFSRGTYQMVNTVANSYSLTIVGGGDTDVAINKAGESSRMTYISTGGGAFLQLLEGSELPGIKALQDCHERPETAKASS